MFGAMTSLTGGGGLSAPSSATATNGDFGASSGVGGFTINAGGTEKENITKWIVIGVALVLAVIVWKK